MGLQPDRESGDARALRQSKRSPLGVARETVLNSLYGRRICDSWFFGLGGHHQTEPRRIVLVADI